MKGMPVRRGGVTRHSFTTTKRAAWMMNEDSPGKPALTASEKKDDSDDKKARRRKYVREYRHWLWPHRYESAPYLRWLWWLPDSN